MTVVRRAARAFWVIATVFVVLAAVRSAAAGCDDPFANPDEVLDFHLQTTSANWAAMQASEAVGEGCAAQYPYFPAEFRCGESEPFLAMDFRRKRDRSETVQKLPLKLDFNRTIAGQRWPAALGALGYRKLTLNSGQADDTGRMPGMLGASANSGVLSALLTEHLAWRVMRQELSEASGVAYARLTLHFTDTQTTQYQGLYILIEDVDRTAIRARFGVDQGLLLKTTDLSCVDEPVFDDGAPNAATDAFTAWLAEEPANFVGGWYARTDQAIHLDPLLRQEALRELLANTGDTVLGNINNYFALDLANGKRQYLPWDLDDMFRPFPQVRAANTAFVLGCQGRTSCDANRVGINIRDNPEIRLRYLEIMCQLANGVALESKLLAELSAIDALIRPIIATEVEPVWLASGRDPLDATVAGTYASEFERMKTWIPERIQAVRTLIETEGVACAPGCTEGTIVACESFGLPSRRVCAGGTWSACESRGPIAGAVGGASGGQAGAGAGPGAGAGSASVDGMGGSAATTGGSSDGGGLATGGVVSSETGGTSDSSTGGEFVAEPPPASRRGGCSYVGVPSQGRGAHWVFWIALATVSRRRRVA